VENGYNALRANGWCLKTIVGHLAHRLWS